MCKRNNKQIFLSMFLLILLVITVSCDIERRETKIITYDQYFAFNPLEILEQLSQGNTDVFFPIDEANQILPSSENFVIWSQEEYEIVVGNLHDYIWGESISEWALSEMGFRLGCDQIGTGFRSGNFVFFSEGESNNQTYRIRHDISINLKNNTIHATEYKYEPRWVEWQTIDLENIISAEQVLEIAEQNGGREGRLEINNMCEISIYLAPDSAASDNWIVGYTQSGNPKHVFRLVIDPFTRK